jgi:hypothetical protein
VKSSFVSAIFGLLSLGGALAHGEASPVLSKVSGSESNVVANWVDAAYRSIAVDDLPIYLEVHQTFGFRIKGSRYFLAPVVYSSKEYRNRVCDLAMFSSTGQILSRVVVSGTRREDDEVSESCIGFNAISLGMSTDGKGKIFIILRQNVGQQYRSSGVVAWLDPGLPKLLPNLGEEKSSWKSVDSIAQLKKLSSEQAEK